MDQKSLRSYVDQIDQASKLDLVGILDDLKLSGGSRKSIDVGTQCSLLLELDYSKLPKLPASKLEEKGPYLIRRRIHSDGRVYVSTNSHRKASRQLYDSTNHYLDDANPKDDQRTVFSLMHQ